MGRKLAAKGSLVNDMVSRKEKLHTNQTSAWKDTKIMRKLAELHMVLLWDGRFKDFSFVDTYIHVALP